MDVSVSDAFAFWRCRLSSEHPLRLTACIVALGNIGEYLLEEGDQPGEEEVRSFRPRVHEPALYEVQAPAGRDCT